MKPLKILLTVMAAGVVLSGCVTLLPKQQPVQLYRFGYDPASLGKDGEVSQRTLTPAPTALALGQVSFPQEASGDRILTSENNEISYVGASRWAVPAQVLFNEALSDGFSRAGNGLRLEPRGPSTAPFRIDLNVRRFETDYRRGKATVSVDMDARLIRVADHSIVSERFITADIGLQHNDMNDMVEAYDKATTQAILTLIEFCTETTASTNPDTAPTVLPGQVPVAK